MHFTLADLITDIAQNGVESGAAEIALNLSEIYTAQGAELRFSVSDNGKGMDPETLKRVIDPFVTDGVKHPHRKVGLGIPFLIQTAEQSGGSYSIKSKVGEGTTVEAHFDLGNVDTPPIGDIPGVWRSLLMFQGPSEMIFHRIRAGGSLPDLDYEVRRSELLDALGSLEDTGCLILLKEYLEGLES
jgi:hypothetical protein